ncbi:ABC transporter substrate-binding protein [Sorangium sp. So ce321]|uniref:ABC transporter substrate-binding protein n=1 Tax=Sorangium sp. So ce321 TaxID=3133300 RepID=UPI003F5ECA49
MTGGALRALSAPAVRWSLAALAVLLALGAALARPGAPRPPAEVHAAVTAVTRDAPGEAAPDAQRGRAIYLRGASASGPEITAAVGAGSGAVVPATVLPCVQCHGRDGRGRPEGGLSPSNIRWEALSRPYSAAEASGRLRPPYTERALGRAITMGLDPAGNRLQDAMPRYRLSRRDLADLLAYLKALSAMQDPGLEDGAIRIGTMIPSAGQLADSGRAARAALSAYFEDLNRQGGIYGRRLEFASVEVPAAGTAPEARARAARAFLDDEPPFALAGVLLDGDGAELAELVEARQIPLIGVISPSPRITPALDRHIFALYAGVAEQGEALAALAARQRPLARAAVVLPPAAREVGRRIAAKLRQAGAGEVTAIEIGEGATAGADAAAALSRSGAEVVVLLGPASAARGLWSASIQGGARPLFLVPGALAGEALLDAPAALAGRLLTSLPALPSDRAPAALGDYRRLAAEHRLSGEHLTAELSALAAAKILVEGLKRAGRELTREALVEAVEGLRDFPTGLTPPITYGPARRIGALGAYPLALDPEQQRLTPAGGWIPVE